MLNVISEYLGAFITTLSTIIFGKYILKLELNNNRFLIIFVALSLSIIVESLFVFDSIILKTILCFLCYFLMFRIAFKINVPQGLFAAIIFYFFLICSVLFVFIIIIILFNTNGYYLYTCFGQNFICNAFVCLLCILLAVPFTNRIQKIFNAKFSNNFLAYWIIIILCLIIFYVSSISKREFSSETVLIFIIIVIVVSVAFVSFSQLYFYEDLLKKYDKLLEFIKEYENEIDNQRINRHESRNQLLIIKSKIMDNDNKENILNYIDILLNETQLSNSHECAKLKNLPSNGLKGLFYFKVNEAMSHGIDVNLNVSPLIKESFLKTMDEKTFNNLGKLLGIYLDNAIEGAASSCKKIIGIEMYYRDNGVLFAISNTYNNKVNYSISGNHISSKGINRGHGLILAKKIINNDCKTFISDTIIMEDLYIQKLIIKNII